MLVVVFSFIGAIVIIPATLMLAGGREKKVLPLHEWEEANGIRDGIHRDFSIVFGRSEKRSTALIKEK